MPQGVCGRSALRARRRAALTSRSNSPGLFDVMAALGRAESLARLKDKAPKRG
jgi:hypothetical protein